ncbi:MAG: hypothetical protein ACI94Y_003733 [Maribacter sp.]|jgi:uncharacterized protein (DUF697 family)
MKILKTVNKARKILRPMSNLKDSQSKHSESVIRNHVLWSMGAGAFIPVPFLDSLGVAAIQLDMVRQLSRVYNLDFEDTKYKAIVSSILGTFLARAGAKSLIKLIPIAGSYIGGAAMGILSGASTYTLGELFKNHFENGGTMLDVDIDRMKRQFSEKFEKNKDVVKKIRNEHEKQREEGKKKSGFSTPVVDKNGGEPISDETDAAMSIADELKKLAELKDAGVISETEFNQLKKNLIDKMM